MNLGVLDRVPELDIVLFGIKDGHEFLAEVYFFGRRGIVFGDDVGIAGDGVDDDGGVVLTRPAYFDGLCAIVDDDHFFEIDFALEIFAALQYVASHQIGRAHV